MKIKNNVHLPTHAFQRHLSQSSGQPPEQQPEPTPQKSGGIADTLTDAFLGGMRSYAALPGFFYPSVYGTAIEKDVIYQTLESLPLEDVAKVASVRMKDTLGSPNLLGLNRPTLGAISINRTGYGMDLEKVSSVLIHEVGHSVDYPNQMASQLTGGLSSSDPWGTGPFISDYAGTMAPEDFAESYRAYHLRPEELKATAPGKFEALQEAHEQTFLEAFVDRPAFRETGQLVGKAMGKVPYLRWGLEFASQMAAMNAAMTGVGDVLQGNLIRGAVGTGAGLALAFSQSHPLLGPVGLALMGARDGYDRALEEGVGMAGAAGSMVGAATGGLVGGFVAPLGLTMAGHALAGPVGGAVGLMVGAFTGPVIGTTVGSKVGMALGSNFDEDL